MKKLHHKIFLAHLLILTVTLIVLFVSFPYIITNDFFEGGKTKMQQLITKTIATVNPENQHADKTPKQIVDEIYQKVLFDPYTEIVIFNRNGDMLYEDYVNNYNKFFNRDFINNTNFFWQTKGTSEILHINYNGQKYFICSIELEKPIYPGGVVLGFAKTTEFYTTSVDCIKEIISILFVLVFLGFITISFFAAKKISQPINELQQYALNIGENKPNSFTPDTSSAEIYSLGISIQKMEHQLRKCMEKQQEYFSKASHQLKTPLMKIQGYGEGLADGLFNDTRTIANIIVKECKHLNRIVEQLLLLSKIEDPTIQYDFTKIEVNEFVESVIESYYIGHNTITFEPHPTETLVIYANSELLHQAVDNPLSNSLRYAKSFVHIKIEKRNQYAVIIISDDGGGISEEHMPHIFERFYKAQKGCVGLGMPIMKSAVEAMNGFVNVKNSDCGLVVELNIPLASSTMTNMNKLG